jgi:signal transduction histidine kinase
VPPEKTRRARFSIAECPEAINDAIRLGGLIWFSSLLAFELIQTLKIGDHQGNLVTNDYSSDVAAIGRIDVVPMILEVMCRVTGLGFAAVARVTTDRWIACAVRDEIAFGLEPGGELQIETTICNEIREHGRVVAIDHVAEDERFCGHPTPEMYGFQSYISVPIRLPDGRFFGTLCAIDPKPARVNRFETIGMFKLFADLIAQHLDAQERVTRTETALQDERQRTELQEQFIAVVGHDLRNPLSAIQTGAKTLLKMPLSSQAAHIVSVVDRSAARMTGLIHDVLDFARSRLGGGLAVTRVLDDDVETMIEEVTTEMRTARPDRTIHSEVAARGPILCDRARIGQLLSNLLANALTHGDPASPVWVRAACSDNTFELSVANEGPQIPPDTVARLFQPFARASSGPDRGGLGLGLYIASEIARSHGGSVVVTSSTEETRFTFRMPLLQRA